MASASALGACVKTNRATNWQALIDLFFSPQGLEFCQKHNFPGLAGLQHIKSETAELGVFIDAGAVERTDPRKLALIGLTDALLTFTDNTIVHQIVLMHGAKAKIKASDYVVLQITNISGNEVEIEKDATVVIL